MNPITIKPLTSELNKDYLDFFDNRAFTDGNPNGPCYCTSPNQDEETIKKMFFHGEVSFNDEVYITNIRQKNSLQDALDSLNLVVQSIEDDMPEDFYSIDLMSAYESLGKMIGESVEDDLVNEIFSKFCMGK